MRIVIALGGNALLQRGQPMTAENQRTNMRAAGECVAAADAAFGSPTKSIGPVYDGETAERPAAASMAIAPDGDKFRRVVPSPKRKRIFEIRAIRSLLEQGTIVICAAGTRVNAS